MGAIYLCVVAPSDAQLAEAAYVHAARLALNQRYSDNVLGTTGVHAPVIPRLNAAPEKAMSPIAHSPMTLSLLAAV
jgi:hypothetical protein